MRTSILWVCLALLLAGAAAEEGKSSREWAIEVDHALKADPKTYPRKQVEACTAAAILELNACKPVPEIVAKLAALGDNTWLEMNEPEARGTPANHHSFPKGRGEGSAVYDASVKGMVCFGGCGAPQYSNDLWVYRAGANRWFEVWPNVDKKNWNTLGDAIPGDRPYPGCTLGLAFAAATGKTYRFTCANTGSDSPNVWETEVLSGKWRIAGRHTTGAGGVRIVEDSVLGGLVAVLPGKNGTQLFSFKTGKWEAIGGEGPTTTSCYALTYLPKHKMALLVTARPQDDKTAFGDGKPREVQTWLFHSTTKTWEQVAAKPGPEWYYRGGIAYDSANDVAAFGGWKTNSPGNGPEISPGLWIFDPNTKTWAFTKPKSGPDGRYEYFCYDPEYNVFVTAGNGHGTWVYRYKQAPVQEAGK